MYTVKTLHSSDIKTLMQHAMQQQPYTAKSVSWEEEGLIYKKTKTTNEISLIYQ